MPKIIQIIQSLLDSDFNNRIPMNTMKSSYKNNNNGTTTRNENILKIKKSEIEKDEFKYIKNDNQLKKRFMQTEAERKSNSWRFIS